MSRTWDNATSLRDASSKIDKSNWPFAEVVVTVPKGPRLTYKILDKKGRSIWAREPVRITLIKQVPPKRAKKRKVPLNSETPPNMLNFVQTKYSRGSTGVVEVNYNNEAKDVITGHLWTNFRVLLMNGWSINNGQWHNPGFVSEIEAATNSALDIALGRFYAKAKNSNENFAQDIAERRQTVRMFSDSVVRLAKALRTLRRGDPKSALKALLPNNPRGVASDWLMFQYGIKPLVNGIDGIAKTLAENKPIVFDITASATVKVPEFEKEVLGSLGYVVCPGSVRVSGEVTVKYKSRVQVQPSAIPFFKELGFGNLPLLAWELIPFSFVADWFVPIGQFLSTLDAFDGLMVRWTTRTVFKKQKTMLVRQFGGTDTTSGYTWITSPASAFISTERISCVRELISSPPPVSLPRLKDPVSATHLSNAVALVIQLAKGKKS
jgi:hypothetical protein